MKDTFRISSLRTLKSPSDLSVTTYFVWVNMRNLPDDMPTKVNPREVNMRTTTGRKLLDAVSNADPCFDIHNRGMVLLANGVKFESSNSTLEIDFDDDEDRYGVLDGGHTYEAIKQRRKDIPADMDKFVRLEILVGNDLDVAALSDARNSSAQVSDIALFNLENRFEFIKKAIKDQPYRNDVAYKDNEDKRIPIDDILSLMYAFNIDNFPDDNTVPISSYSGKASVFKDFKNKLAAHHLRKDENKPDQKNIYLKLTPWIPTFVKLYETIEIELPDKYREYKDGKAKLGAVRGIEHKQGQTEYTQSDKEYNISSGFIMPIYGAFRALLKNTSDGKLDWYFDPIEVWNSIGTALVQNTFDTDTNPNSAGKSKTLWQANYRIVENEKNRRRIKQLEQMQF